MLESFIAVNGRLLNLQTVAMVDDQTEEGGEPTAVITTNVGAELEFTGEDATALFDRIELLAAATESAIDRIQQIATQGVQT